MAGAYEGEEEGGEGEEAAAAFGAGAGDDFLDGEEMVVDLGEVGVAEPGGFAASPEAFNGGMVGGELGLIGFPELAAGVDGGVELAVGDTQNGGAELAEGAGVFAGGGVEVGADVGGGDGVDGLGAGSGLAEAFADDKAGAGELGEVVVEAVGGTIEVEGELGDGAGAEGRHELDDLETGGGGGGGPLLGRGDEEGLAGLRGHQEECIAGG